jgi:hypothetical protein
VQTWESKYRNIQKNISVPATSEREHILLCLFHKHWDVQRKVKYLRNLTHTPLLFFPDLFQAQGTCNHNQTCVAYLLQVNMKGELWKMDYSSGKPPNEILCIQPRGNFITMKFPPTVDLELTKLVGYVNTVRRWYIPCLHLVDHILLWESRASIAWDSSSPY